jgi:hypothetical protein
MSSPCREARWWDVLNIHDKGAGNFPVYVFLYAINSDSVTAHKTIIVIHNVTAFAAYVMVFAEIG